MQEEARQRHSVKLSDIAFPPLLRSNPFRVGRCYSHQLEAPAWNRQRRVNHITCTVTPLFDDLVRLTDLGCSHAMSVAEEGKTATDSEETSELKARTTPDLLQVC